MERFGDGLGSLGADLVVLEVQLPRVEGESVSAQGGAHSKEEQTGGREGVQKVGKASTDVSEALTPTSAPITTAESTPRRFSERSIDSTGSVPLSCMTGNAEPRSRSICAGVQMEDHSPLQGETKGERAEPDVLRGSTVGSKMWA